MATELTPLEKEIRAEYTGTIACMEGLVEGLPRLVANFATAAPDLMLTVLMDVKSEYGWRLSDHFLAFRENLDQIILYGEKLAVLIDETDEQQKKPAAERNLKATFTLDGTEYELMPGIYTATDILADLGFSHTPGGDVLFLTLGDDLYTEISGMEVVRLQDGMEFVTEQEA